MRGKPIDRTRGNPVVNQRAAAVQDRSVQQHNNEPQQTNGEKKGEEEGEKSREERREERVKEKWQRKRTVQIFVKVDGMKTVLMVSPEDKVQNILNTVSGSDPDVCVTRHVRALRRSEKLKSFGATDGCTTHVTSKMRVGALRVQWISRARRAKWRRWQESEFLGYVSEGNDIEVEQKIQCGKFSLQAKPGVDKGHKKVLECGIRWAVEARREVRCEERE